MSAFLKTVLGTDFEIRTDSDPVDPLAKFLERAELRKNASPVLDESWNSPMGDIEQECFDKAIESAAAAIKTFVENNAERLMTDQRLPWEELVKTFREERPIRFAKI
jgi:hypothetical protein